MADPQLVALTGYQPSLRNKTHFIKRTALAPFEDTIVRDAWERQIVNGPGSLEFERGKQMPLPVSTTIKSAKKSNAKPTVTPQLEVSMSVNDEALSFSGEGGGGEAAASAAGVGGGVRNHLFICNIDDVYVFLRLLRITLQPVVKLVCREAFVNSGKDDPRGRQRLGLLDFIAVLERCKTVHKAWLGKVEGKALDDDLLDAFVAVGGSDDCFGTVDANVFRDIVEEFNLNVDVDSIVGGHGGAAERSGSNLKTRMNTRLVTSSVLSSSGVSDEERRQDPKGMDFLGLVALLRPKNISGGPSSGEGTQTAAKQVSFDKKSIVAFSVSPSSNALNSGSGGESPIRNPLTVFAPMNPNAKRGPKHRHAGDDDDFYIDDDDLLVPPTVEHITAKGRFASGVGGADPAQGQLSRSRPGSSSVLGSQLQGNRGSAIFGPSPMKRRMSEKNIRDGLTAKSEDRSNKLEEGAALIRRQSFKLKRTLSGGVEPDISTPVSDTIPTMKRDTISVVFNNNSNYIDLGGPQSANISSPVRHQSKAYPQQQMAGARPLESAFGPIVAGKSVEETTTRAAPNPDVTTIHPSVRLAIERINRVAPATAQDTWAASKTPSTSAPAKPIHLSFMDFVDEVTDLHLFHLPKEAFAGDEKLMRAMIAQQQLLLGSGNATMQTTGAAGGIGARKSLAPLKSGLFLSPSKLGAAASPFASGSNAQQPTLDQEGAASINNKSSGGASVNSRPTSSNVRLVSGPSLSQTASAFSPMSRKLQPDFQTVSDRYKSKKYREAYSQLLLQQQQARSDHSQNASAANGGSPSRAPPLPRRMEQSYYNEMRPTSAQRLAAIANSTPSPSPVPYVNRGVSPNVVGKHGKRH